MIGNSLLFVFAFFICEGYSVTEIRLPDRYLSYIRNQHLGTSIGIPTAFFNTMTDCHIIFPSRTMYEAFPLNTLPHANVFFMDSVDLFRSCSIGFRDVGVEFSGTYELLSASVHFSDNSVSLTRQRFHLTVSEPNFG
ncbi:jg6283 [Pararge aegeria aegeria]|uniref:Jg6283 protein n=1 Tax=Pararge aegeria aegeria TaxID=348720 RepID=A0A8S4SNQ1_9NEOP|nr:jg6283 [Pararge aegeria aegeria]